MYNLKQLAKVLKDILTPVGLYSDSVLVLETGTCKIESNLGTYLYQIGGPALGPYQMEPDTHDDIWINFLKYQPKYSDYVKTIAVNQNPNQLITNLTYSTLMCRFHYLRVKEPLPAANDAQGMANYHKKYYNTNMGKTDVNQSVIEFQTIITQLGV
jgi:hypothetical protein